VADTTWGERVITWNSRPPTGDVVLAAATIDNSTTVARWYEWDVTAYVQQEKAAGRSVITLALKNEDDSSPFVTFRSRTATSLRPELLLTP
jgi:hypothetical protein